MTIPPSVIEALQEFAVHAVKKTAHAKLDQHLVEHAPPPHPLSETERKYLINKTQCDQLNVQLQHDQNQLQAARLELDRQRAQLELAIQREQLEWQKQSHQAQIEQSKQQIQADFDQNRWAGIWSRDELFTILQNSAQRHYLLVLLSEPEVTPDCPDIFKHTLPTQVRNKLTTFMRRNYPIDHPQPVQFFGRFFEKSVFDSHIAQYENLLRDSVPTVALYGGMTSLGFHLHSHPWGFGERDLKESCELDWSEAVEQLMADGMTESKAQAEICKIIIDLYAAFSGLLLRFVLFAHRPVLSTAFIDHSI